MPNPTDAPAEQVEGYRDLSVIGGGATSWVYRAYQDRVRRWVALKVLQVDGRSDAVRQRFDRERSLLAELGAHPHIVQVLDAGSTAAGRPYVAMDLCDGSLADLVERDGPLAVPDALDLMMKIAGAVQAAHHLGVLHGDIKPQNILLGRYGPVLADFGVARAAGGLGATRAVMQLSPLYAAPEVFFATAPPSEASDVYSLGATLFAVLTGRTPFSGVSDEDVYRYLSRRDADHPGAIGRSDLPDGLVAVIARSINADPEHRQAGAARFAFDLHRCRERVPAARATSRAAADEVVARRPPASRFDPAGLIFPDPAARHPEPDPAAPPALPPRPPAGVASRTTYVPSGEPVEPSTPGTDGGETRTPAVAAAGTTGPRVPVGGGAAASTEPTRVATRPSASDGSRRSPLRPRPSRPSIRSIRSADDRPGTSTSSGPSAPSSPAGVANAVRSILTRHRARLVVGLTVLCGVAALVVAGLWATAGPAPEATSDAPSSSAPPSSAGGPTTPATDPSGPTASTAPSGNTAPVDPVPALATFGFRTPPDADRYRTIQVEDQAAFGSALGTPMPDPQTREVVHGGNVVGLVFAYPVSPEAGVDSGRWTAVPLRHPDGTVAPIGDTPVRIVPSGKNWAATWWASNGQWPHGMVAVFGNEAHLRAFLAEWDSA